MIELDAPVCLPDDVRPSEPPTATAFKESARELLREAGSVNTDLPHRHSLLELAHEWTSLAKVVVFSEDLTAVMADVESAARHLTDALRQESPDLRNHHLNIAREFKRIAQTQPL
jgi:hypothetical protein